MTLDADKFLYDPDEANVTILFSMWHDKGITPETMEPGYEEMKPLYIKWLKERGYT